MEPNKPKQVKCIETGEIYSSVNATAKALGTYTNAVRRAIKTGIKCKGVHLEFVRES